MVNIFGSHKIGIIGDANSGKTVFLTSLLWNLEQRSLRLGKHSDMPTSVRIELPKNISPQHRFDYAGNKRQLQQHNQWPDKTVADYSLAKCSYDLPKYLRRKLTFVDIPGERLADVLVWECPNYAEWSERTLDQWRGSKDLSGYFNGFIKLLQCPNDNITPEVLSQSFKLGIRNTVFNYVPVVTPSTLFFDDGKMATWEEVNDNKWLGNRPIWKGGDFFPLPTEWKQSKGTQTGEIYRKCEANYRKYRKQVVLPIFAQIASCDSCIYCVDIFSILGSGGPAAFTSCSEEIKSFVHTLTQGNLHHLLRNWRRCRISKVAYVATKSDLVYGDDLDCLQSLLEDLVSPCDEGSKLESKCFTCTAWCSTWRSGEQTMVKSDKSSGPVSLRAAKLPMEFPKDWKPEAFSALMQSIFPATAGAKPPQQTGIDTIMTFVTE